MTRPFSIAAALATLAAVACAAEYSPSSTAPPPVTREFRGAWVATVHNIDWPSSKGSAASQQAELRAIMDAAAAMRLNAVIFQVRPACDALYNSQIEPWSLFLTGSMGRNPGFDPLAVAIQEAHARGLELHAWFNPFRALANVEHAAASTHVSKARREWCRRYGQLLWLDPGEPAVRELTLRVIFDVVSRYDVDGIHIDDYFYPYPIERKSGKQPFPDDDTFKRYGSGSDRSAWRRKNIDSLVQSIASGVHSRKPWVKFGVSPFGIWRPGSPSCIKASLDAYEDLAADSRKWLQAGWVDYLAPQLYWPTTSSGQPFAPLVTWWSEQNSSGRHLWPGLAIDRIGSDRKAGEIVRQIQISRQARCTGNIHWNLKPLRQNKGGIADALRSGPYLDRAVVPASPWLAGGTPSKPALSAAGGPSGTTSAQWSGDGARFWVVQSRSSGRWTTDLVGAAHRSFNFPANRTPDVIAVRGVGPSGQLGPASVVAR